MTASLLQRTARSTAWTFLGAQTVTVATLASSIVVAHFLTPHDLGTYALVALIVSLASTGATLFAGSYYVITPNPSQRLLRTGLALELGLGLALWLALIAGVGVYAVLGGSWQFTGLLVIEASMLVANPVGSPVGSLTATFTRDFAYRTPTLAWMAAVLTSVALKIGLVVAGVGAWGLVIGDSALFFVYGAVMLALVPAGRGLAFDRELAAALLAFGVPSLATNIMTLLSERAGEFAVAIVLGTHALGIYYLAARLPFQVYQLGGGLSVAFLTAFSRSNERQLARGFMLATRLSAFFIFLPLALVIPLAGPFITVVYGSVWRPAATPFVLLMAAIAVRFTFWHVVNALKSRGKVNEIAILTATQLVLVAVGSVLGAWAWSLKGAALAALVTELALVAPKIRLIRTLVPFDPLVALRAPTASLALGVALAVVVAATLPEVPALVAASLAVLSLFAAAAWLSDRESLATILASFRKTRFGN